MNFLTRLQQLINVSVNHATKLAVIENVTLEEILPRLTLYPLAGVDFLSSKDNEHVACIVMMVYIIIFVKVLKKTSLFHSKRDGRCWSTRNNHKARK